jgi:uncharacterized protein YdhG (YjbR/CyaY superfamily)
MPAKKATQGLTAEEKAAMRATLRERRRPPRPGTGDGEADVLAAIAEMPPADRKMAERFHAIVKANAPDLTPRTWYGMPAYSKEDQVICYFRSSHKFKTRYATLGFSDEAKLDDGHMWPTDFALNELTPAEEARISELVRRAVSSE